MPPFRRHPLRAILLALPLLAWVAAAPSAAPRRVEDFTFIHCSDIHVPAGVTMRAAPVNGVRWGSEEVVGQIKGLREPIRLAPYDVTVTAPSFAIATGDLTEFGGNNGWWEQYLELWKGAPFPVYHASGNHDATWACQRYHLRELHGGAFYSFNRSGCHFIALDSATPQDPRPSFGEEEIQWLREDLKGLSPETPVFVYCHHPIDGNEFASLYERDRLLDLLRPYNLALILVGHGHAAEHRVVSGVDQVMGGSTFGKAPGYSVVSVKDGVLRVAYRRASEDAAAVPLLEKPLAPRSTYPRLRFQPRAEAESRLRLRARIEREGVVSARWEADDEKGRSGELARDGDEWRADVDAAAWEPGVHFIRVTFSGPGAEKCQRTERVEMGAGRRVAWRARMGGSGKGSPCVTGDLVVAGAGDGVLYAFDRRSGQPRWRFKTGGEILAQPLAADGAFYFGSGDGRFYAVNADGKPRWSHPVGVPVYSSAVVAEGRVVFAANNGHVYALDPKSGARAWECAAPQYSIESRPFVHAGTLYYGCWDSHVYAINAANGEVRWRKMGTGAASYPPGVARYYSPADAGPVVAGDQLWAADRAFHAARMDPATGDIRADEKGVSSVGLSPSGDVYLRGTDGSLRRVHADGSPVWSAPALTSIVPTLAVERDGVVYTVSSTGRLLALEAKDGRRRWEYQVTPRLYVFSDPVPTDEMVYVTGMDGSLTALRTGSAY